MSVVAGVRRSVAANTPFSPIRFRVADRFDNPVAGVSVVLIPPAAGPTVSFGVPPVTDAAGLTQVNAGAGTAAGPVSVTVVAGTGQGTFGLTVLAGPFALLAVAAGSGQTAAVGAAFKPVQVVASDAFGNPVGGGSVALTAPAAGAGAAVPATVSTAADGTGAFTPTANTVAGG